MTFEQKNENAANVTQGSFSFVAGGGFSAFQNFVRGNRDGACTACSYTEAERDVTNHLRFSRYEMYAQDSWRARPNLTVDLGVRYSLFPPITDTNNMLVTFDPSVYKAASAPPYANAAGTLVDYSVGDPLVGLIIAGKNSPYGDAIYAFKKNSIQPRIGFTLDPASNGDTIIRGAYGIYYDQPLVGIFEQNSFTSPPFVNNVSLSGGVRLSNPGAGVSAGDLRRPHHPGHRHGLRQPANHAMERRRDAQGFPQRGGRGRLRRVARRQPDSADQSQLPAAGRRRGPAEHGGGGGEPGEAVSLGTARSRCARPRRSAVTTAC